MARRGLRARGLRARQSSAEDIHGLELLHRIGRGTLGVADACNLARSARADDSIAQVLSALGTRREDHRERDLHTWAARQPWRRLLPGLYAFACTKCGQGERDGEIFPSEHFALLPHEQLACLADAGPDLLAHVCGPREAWAECWRARAAAAAAARAEDDEDYAEPADPAGCVPLGVHGDDAGVQVSEKITIVNFGAVTSPGPTWDSRILFTCVKGSDAERGANVLDEAYRVLAWSLRCVTAGTFPDRDHNGVAFGPAHHPARAAKAGQPLGLYGKIVEVRGDWKFLREALRLRQHYGRAERICHLCRATKWAGPEHFSDFSRGAACRVLTTNAEWREEQERLGPTPFLEIPGFNIRMVHFDIMHTLDLGILQLALPSALHELVHAGEFGEGPLQARLQVATRQYRRWCKRNRVSAVAPRFKQAWIRLPHPQIGQVHAKAAAARSMQYWMRDVCERRANSHPGQHASMRWGLFWHLCSADHVMRRGRRHLRPAEHDQLQRRVESALQCYGWLSGRARTMGIPLWRLIPKHHAMTHIGFDTKGVNPRHVQCYMDEDMVGKMKRLYIKCHAQSAPRRSLERYVLGQAARWLRALQQLHPMLREKRPRPE